MSEIICPRTDLPIVAAELYHALKNKPCNCQWAWRNGVYGPSDDCAMHKAMARYEAITEAQR